MSTLRRHGRELSTIAPNQRPSLLVDKAMVRATEEHQVIHELLICPPK